MELDNAELCPLGYVIGGNGMTKEYPMEKLVRDTRACLIADGCNEYLALKGGTLLVNPELL